MPCPECLASLRTRLSADKLLHSPLPRPRPLADDAAPAKDDARVKHLETAFSAQQMSLDSQSQQISDLKSMIHDLASALSSQNQRDPASGSSNFTRAAQVATARALNLSPYPDPSATPDEKDHLGNMFTKLLPSKPSSADTSGKPPNPSQDDLLLNLRHVELTLPNLKTLIFDARDAQGHYNDQASAIAIALKRTANDPAKDPSTDPSFRHCANMATNFGELTTFFMATTIRLLDERRTPFKLTHSIASHCNRTPGETMSTFEIAAFARLGHVARARNGLGPNPQAETLALVTAEKLSEAFPASHTAPLPQHVLDVISACLTADRMAAAILISQDQGVPTKKGGGGGGAKTAIKGAGAEGGTAVAGEEGERESERERERERERV